MVQAAEARMDIHLRAKDGAAKALKAAIEALELLMEAQARAPTQDQKVRLKAKLKQLMLRAEEIKKVQKQQLQEAVVNDVKKGQEEIERLSFSKSGTNVNFSGSSSGLTVSYRAGCNFACQNKFTIGTQGSTV